MARLSRPARSKADLLVVGLGNPGEEYAGTRHNVGAMAVERLASRLGCELRSGRERARAGLAILSRASAGPDRASTDDGGPEALKIALAVPSSYMNESGDPVARVARRFGVEPLSIVVLHDDLDLPLAQLRLKRGGGSGGHKGLESMRRRLGSDEFMRVRIGIGRPPGSMDPADYVLKRFRKPEQEEAEHAVEMAGDAVLAIATDGIDSAMNQFN